MAKGAADRAREVTVDLDALKRSVDMVALLQNYGVELKQRGQEYDALCIWHTETHPSMQVYVDAKDGHQRAHCKSCGKGGTVVDVVMCMDCCDEAQAIAKLKANGYHRDGTRIKAEAPIKLNVWQHEIAPDKPPAMKIKECGEPVAVWRYNNADGKCLGYVARYLKPDGTKDYRPWTYGRYSQNVDPTWKSKTWTHGERPLFGLDELAKRPTAKVAIVEGEKAAMAARQLLAGMVVIAWPGGSSSVHGVDWTPLAGRHILLIPDNDKAGRKAMQMIGDHAQTIGCTVRGLDTSDQTEKWDLADAFEEGWDSARLAEWAAPRITPHISKAELREMEAFVNSESAIQAPEDMSEFALPPMEEYPEPEDGGNIPPPGIPYASYLDGTSDHVFPIDPADLFSAFVVPPLRRGLLPKIIDDYIFDLAECINTDPAFGALTALSVIAGLLDDRIKIKIADGFTESARIWTMCVGEPSTKKTPIMDAVLFPLREITRKVAQEDAATKQRQDILDARHKAKVKEYTDACIKSDDHGLPEPVPPKRLERKRVIVDNLTREGLERALQDMPSGVYLHSDEISGWIGSMDAYKQSGTNSDRPLWIRAFGGGPMQIDKVGTGSYLIDNWSVTISGGIQPSRLAMMAPKLGDDGLLQRFLIVSSSRDGGQGIDRPRNRQYADAWAGLLKHIAATTHGGEHVIMAPEAYSAMREAGARIYKAINSKMIGLAFTTAIGKWEGIQARMILIYHAAECAARCQHPESVPVSGETASMAIAYMMEHLLPHMVSFYEDGLCKSEAATIAKLIAGQIIAEGSTEVSTTKLHKTGPGAWRKAPEWIKHESLNRLVEYAWIAPAGGINSATKRPTRFLVNPHVHDLYSRHAATERARIADAHEIGARIRAGSVIT